MLKQWPDVQNKDRNLPISSSNAAVDSKVILRVEKEAGLQLREISEIHVALPCDVGQQCCVLDKPWRHSRQAASKTILTYIST